MGIESTRDSCRKVVRSIALLVDIRNAAWPLVSRPLPWLMTLL